MISYLGSLVQFSPAAGRAGRCRQKSLCVGGTRRVPARQPALLGASPRVLRAFSLRGERPGQLGVWRPFPPRRAARAARGLALSPRAHRAFSLRGPSARRRLGLRKSSDRTRGLFAGWEGAASLGLSFPFPLPLPPTSSGDGAALLWSFSVPLFCKPPSVSSGWLIFLLVNFSSLSHS